MVDTRFLEMTTCGFIVGWSQKYVGGSSSNTRLTPNGTRFTGHNDDWGKTKTVTSSWLSVQAQPQAREPSASYIQPLTVVSTRAVVPEMIDELDVLVEVDAGVGLPRYSKKMDPRSASCR